MKRLIFIILALLLLLTPAVLFAEQVTVAWDPNDPTPDGYRVFERADDAGYDYSHPLWQGPETTATVNVSSIPMKIIKYSFVVRAYEGQLESADSNEVFVSYDRTPPDVIDSIQAVYDQKTSSIALEFIQPGDLMRVDHWTVYYTFTSGKDYVRFDDIPNTGNQKVTVTKPFEAVPDGEKQTVYFVAVGFHDLQSYSANSPEVAVEINRRPVPEPPGNVTVTKVVIPVQ